MKDFVSGKGGTEWEKMTDILGVSKGFSDARCQLGLTYESKQAFLQKHTLIYNGVIYGIHRKGIPAITHNQYFKEGG